MNFTGDSLSNQDSQNMSDFNLFGSQFSDDEIVSPQASILQCNDTFEAKIVQIGNSLMSVHIDSVDGTKCSFSGLLMDSFKCIKQIVENIVALCNDKTEFIKDEIEAYLEQSIKLLQFLENFLEKVLSSAPLNPLVFRDFPKIVACILLEVFGHCKHSESSYGVYFEAMAQKLTNLFKYCQQVQKYYFVVMTDHLKFDLSDDDCLQVLIEALDILVTIGEIVISLDVKTMAEQWKGVCRLYELHNEWLRDKYVAKRAVGLLSKEITNNINSVMTDQLDKKSITRHLKVSNFILRILIKFAECFKQSLTTNFETVVTMLSWLELYSKPYLLHVGKENVFIQEITNNVSIGVEPFLHILIEDLNFVKSYFEFEKTALGDAKLRIGYMILTIHVLKILLKTQSSTARDLFLSSNSNENILIRLIELSSEYSIEFSLGLKFEVVNKKGDLPLSCFLYEYVLIHTSAIAATLKPDQFAILEKFLCASIVLQSNYWRASLASDVWCALARYGSANLCMDQVTFLMKLYEQLCSQHGAFYIPQKAYLGSIINRLFNLLPDKHKTTLFEKYSIEENLNVWIAIRFDSIAIKCTEEKGEQLLMALLTMQRSFIQGELTKGEDICKLINLISLISTGISLPVEKRGAVVNNTLKMWRIIGSDDAAIKFYSEDESSAVRYDWIYKCVEAVTQITCYVIDDFTNETLSEVAITFRTLVAQGNSRIALSALSFLKTVANFIIKDDEHAKPICDSIILLFESLLGSELSTIYVLCLETFAHFSCNTNREDIISGIGFHNPKLKMEVITFLQKKIPDKLRSPIVYSEYVEEICKVKFKHKCGSNKHKANKDILNEDDGKKDVFESTFFNEAMEEAPSKKLKLSGGENDDVNHIVNRLQIDVKTLLKISKEGNLSNGVKKRLKCVIDNLNNVLSET